MSGTGRASRAKGRRGEQIVATILRSHMPEIASAIRRGWQNRLGADDPDICGLPGFWLEHKCGKQPNIRAALKQARIAAKGRCMPLAVIQDDHGRERMACLNLTDFLRVLRAAYGYTPPLKFGVQGELFEVASDEVAE